MNSKYSIPIRELKRRIEGQFGRNLERVLVFGSVARGTDHGQSDVDVLVVLKQVADADRWHFEKSLRDVAFAVELEHDIVLDLKLAGISDLSGLKGHTPFMEHVLREGVTV